MPRLRPSSILAQELTNQFKSLEASRKEIERLYSAKKISRRAVLHSYEGLFLRAHVAFERFIEDLFIGLLVEDSGLVSSSRDVTARIRIKSHKIAREMIFGRKNYFDWLPIDKTIQMAKIHFRGGRPFINISPAQKQSLQKYQHIRNAIAHRSPYSMMQFKTEVIGATNLPVNERNPAGYLRGIFRAMPNQTRFENNMAEILAVARVLST